MRQTRVRLKPGAIIVFGENEYLASCTQLWRGQVLQVAAGGAVKVRVIEGKPWIGDQHYRKERGNDVRWVWVPHHHLYEAAGAL